MEAGEPVFPLVPRWRLSGSAFEAAPSTRRGGGSDLAGTRPYLPGDDVRSIDWHASARLSLARARDEFVVRERYGEDAPRVVVVRDRRPSLELYPPPFPWLPKPDAIRAAVRLLLASAARVRGLAGYLDAGSGERGPVWLAPASRGAGDAVRDEATSGGTRAGSGLAEAFEHLALFRHEAPPGTFFFAFSDYLGPTDARVWELTLEHRWDVVPVIVQDPVWEQSFPPVGSLVVRFAEPGSGRLRPVRMSRAAATARREEHEARLAGLVAGFRELGLEPVVLGSSDPSEILDAFLDWAELRTIAAGRP